MNTKHLLTAIACGLIASAGVASAGGALSGGFGAAYNLVAGFEVDATAAHDMLISKKAEIRQEARGVVDEAFARDLCEPYYTTETPQLPIDQLESRLDATHSFGKQADLTQEFDSGLVRAKAWGVGDVTGEGWLQGSDALPRPTVDRPDLSGVCGLQGEARGQVYEALNQDVEVEIPTRVSHEEGLAGAQQMTGSMDAIVEAALP